MNILIIGGSGFVSGTLARRALRAGHAVWTVTRGKRETVEGVRSIVADREDGQAFADAIRSQNIVWDHVADCICFRPHHAEQDVSLFLGEEKAIYERFVMVSTDFVYEPSKRTFPQTEANASYIDSDYGSEKRRSELVLINGARRSDWTILRPCHIYGPGSLLGCLPEHSRDEELVERIRSGNPLRLVGGGRFLQQPLFVADLADSIIDCATCDGARGKIANIAGPEIIESRQYYEILAGKIGTSVEVEEIAVDGYLRAHPEKRSFLCHRINALDQLAESGVSVPATAPMEGLTEHLRSIVK